MQKNGSNCKHLVNNVDNIKKNNDDKEKIKCLKLIKEGSEQLITFFKFLIYLIEIPNLKRLMMIFMKATKISKRCKYKIKSKEREYHP